MATTSPSLNHDLRYLRAALDQLEDYLLSKEIYWSGSVYSPDHAGNFPPLTLGWVLFYLQRAAALAQSAKQSGEYSRIDQAIQVKRSKWLHAWETKARSEFSSRLRLWRDFLEEYRHHPEDHFDRYRYEVQKRVLLALLLQEAGEVQNAELELLNALDQLLENCFVSGAFIWEPVFQSAFPKESYWYLYGTLAREHSRKAS